jgi:pyruvate/2-oxoglutarate/acetoin dehydrogenase E1 component
MAAAGHADRRGGIVTTAIGMALYGLVKSPRSSSPTISAGLHQIFSEASRIRYRTAGE